MIVQFTADFLKLQKLIKSQSKYIRSKKTKGEVANFFESNWLPYSYDFKKKFGKSKFSVIESALSKCYAFSKKDYMEKAKLIIELKKIVPVLDEIKLYHLRNYGYIIETSKKDEVIDTLKAKKFSGTLKYLTESEKDFKVAKWKPSCFNSRLALEEFLREFREQFSNSHVKGGTVGDHVANLKAPLSFELGEIQLIKNGLYGFLSNKGGHATKDRPSEEDAKLAITLNYVFIGYFFEKFGRFLS